VGDVDALHEWRIRKEQKKKQFMQRLPPNKTQRLQEQEEYAQRRHRVETAMFTVAEKGKRLHQSREEECRRAVTKAVRKSI
jgi:uncharacterized protein YaaR (DUF327 family)